jgi:hypothetical protein
VRPAAAATTFSDIQFAMGGFINPAQVLNDGAGNVTAQFPPTYALLLPAKLTHPDRDREAPARPRPVHHRGQLPGQPGRNQPPGRTRAF